MNNLLFCLRYLFTGILLALAVYITTPDSLVEVLLWGYLSLMGFFGWDRVFNKEKNAQDKENVQ
jgi:hypothetical protein